MKKPDIDHYQVDTCPNCGIEFVHPDHRIRVEMKNGELATVCSFKCGFALRNKDQK